MNISILKLRILLPAVLTLSGYGPFCMGQSAQESNPSGLVNGREYFMKTTASDHPFLQSKIWDFGTVVTTDAEYRALINYDISQDALVMNFTRNGSPVMIVLNPEPVRHFILNGRKFINAACLSDSCADPGFVYAELISEGNPVLLIRWKKELPANEAARQSSFDLIKIRMVYKDSRFIEIRRNKDVFKLYPGREKEIKSFLRINSTSVRMASDQVLADLMRYVEQAGRP